MRWRDRRRSSNVEDRRGQGAARRGMAVPGGIVGVLVVIGASLFLGVDPRVVLSLLEQGGGAVQEPSTAYQPTAAEQELAEFTAVVLADTEDVWAAQFQAGGGAYREPRLVLFSGATQSSCGQGVAAMGPFYCPADQRVYIDLSFFDDLKRRHGAPGDFAQAYVIAHEVGHHVQNLLGTSGQVQAERRRVDQRQGNALSVRLELQADCYAGVFANHAERTKGILEPGDIDEALTAASAVGDDRLQREARGTVTPDSFTHGTSAQRARWFRAGFSGGTMAGCDTFSSGAGAGGT